MDVEFGNYRLKRTERLLLGPKGPVELSARSFDILAMLLERPDEVISKTELFDVVWPGLVVGENTLQVHISALRKLLPSEMIVTVHGRGYKYAGPRPFVATAEAPAPPRPSIAVLPFQNMSGDPEQEYFADGMVEEIITALTRVRWLFVIARNSSFTYKGRAIDVKQVARELGVRYVLEGSVRKSANKIRVTGQLIDAATGAHLWADRFDGTLQDIFDLQDEVTSKVVGALAPKVEQAEIERAKRKPTDNLDAYDYYLRGLSFVTQTTREANSEALQLFRKAIELDRDFAAAQGMAAWCYMVRKVNGWMADAEGEVNEATQLARRATLLGRDDAVALCWGGFALAYVAGDLENGAAFVNQALALNPNLATAWGFSGWLKIILGQPDAAIECLENAKRLNPLARTLFNIQSGLAWAHFFAGRYDEACSWVQGALRDQPNYLGTVRIAAASFALAGRLEDARFWVARLRELDPALRISNLRTRLPPLRLEDLERYEEGLRQAGLPD
jgi:TolB-like protein/Flp pilus assembly protein TadD